MISDPLSPSSALLPQCETSAGGTVPRPHRPGAVRPFSATLAVTPIEMGRHDTTATKWDKTEATQDQSDGAGNPPKPDTVTIPQYDT